MHFGLQRLPRFFASSCPKTLFSYGHILIYISIYISLYILLCGIHRKRLQDIHSRDIEKRTKIYLQNDSGQQILATGLAKMHSRFSQAPSRTLARARQHNWGIKFDISWRQYLLILAFSHYLFSLFNILHNFFLKLTIFILISSFGMPSLHYFHISTYSIIFLFRHAITSLFSYFDMPSFHHFSYFDMLSPLSSYFDMSSLHYISDLDIYSPGSHYTVKTV